MFRSLHAKLVMILVLLVVSVMSVVGTFLINSVASFYLNEFHDQVSVVFSTDFIITLNNAANDDDPESINYMIETFSGSLGLDSYRNFYILDNAGNYILGSDDMQGSNLTLTDNILSAMTGQVGDSLNVLKDYMDIAVPLGDDTNYIVYIKDNKQEIHDLTWILFSIILQSMLFGLIIALFLSFLLSKTMTNPIENLTRSAQMVAKGDFDNILDVQSNDEIGILTQTFNEMAQIMEKNIVEIEGERDKLNALFLHMTDGVIAFSKAGKVIHMNLAAEKMLDLNFSEELSFNTVFSGINVPKNEDAGKDGYVKCEITRDDRSFNVFFAPFGTTSSDGGLMAVIHDITEQKKLDDARREFVANVSHELRTPLTNVKGYAETLLDGNGEFDTEIQERFLGVILSESDRMTRIVKDLLTLSKLDYGKMEMKFEKVDIRTILETAYSAMKLEANNWGHNFTIELDDKLGEMHADKDRIGQVLVNIISNAIKYTGHAGDIVLHASTFDNKIKMSVTDNGVGIPSADLPRLFERFYRVDKARSREKGGTGLGLAIAKEIVEIHGGTISATSEVGVGTTVEIILPTIEQE